MPRGYHPSAVAKAWRDEHPGLFDRYSDTDLIDAIKAEDPETYKLIDPQLIGAELLQAPAPPPPPGKIPTYPLQHSFTDTAIETGLGVVPAVAGAVLGSSMGPMGTAAGGALGAGAGSAASQYYQKHYGNREEYSPGAMAFDTALGALNPGARGATVLRRVGSQAGYGAAFGGAGTVGHGLIETGELPSPSEFATGVATGAVMGGATHGAFEGYAGIKGHAPDFGDATGALPMDVGAPPPNPMDQLITAQAAATQYQQEEARLAAGLAAVYGPNARPATSPDYHTALQAKDYLEQLAELNKLPVPTPPIQPGLTETPYAPPPPQGLLERGTFEDPSLTDVLPGGGPPGRTIVAGGGPPLSIDRLGGQLESTLQEPPGPPRLMPQSELRLTPESGVARGTSAQPALIERPLQPTSGPLEQIPRVGGRAATPEQPRIPGTDQPAPLDRTYTTGPNAGPRRPARQELHGKPRTVRRRVYTGKTYTYEKAPSTIHAEDPGTYPPEVRRELARILYEMQEYPHERVQGGLTRAQIEDVKRTHNVDTSTAIGILRKSGATAGGSIGGASVFHDILYAADGAYAHAERADIIKALRAALLEGKGSGISDAAAQVARRRTQIETLHPDEQRRQRTGRRLPSGQKVLQFETRSQPGAGDHLIGWVDEHGEQALPEQDLSDAHREARDASDGEILGYLKMEQAGHVPEGMEEHFAAMQSEAVKRGLIKLQQGDLTMEGPGGAKGPSLRDFEGQGQQNLLPAAPPSAESPAEPTPPPEEAAPPPLAEEGPIHWGPEGRAAKDLASLGAEGVQRRVGSAPPGLTEKRHAQLMEKFGGGTEAERRAAGTRPVTTPPPGREGPPPLIPREPNVREPFGPDPVPPEQPSLPGAEGVRTQSLPTPEVADLPFSLSSPKPVGERSLSERPSLLRRLLEEEDGVLILTPVYGDRIGFRKWLAQQEKEHGGTTWFARVEQHLADGNYDRAWKAAASASVRSYAGAFNNAQTPQEEALLRHAVKGTPLQADLNTGIVAGARKNAGVGDAPPVKDFPPSRSTTQAGAARGRATLGPAGIINPGPPRRPLSTAAPELRGELLGRSVVKMVLENTAADEMATIPGNTDTYLRLFRQVGEHAFKGMNLKYLREAGVRIPPEELAQHLNHTISEWGRGLQMLQQFATVNKITLEEAAERWSMGGALHGLIKGEPPPRFVGAGGRVASPKGYERTLDALTADTTVYEQAMAANTLQKKAAVGPLRALHDASYAFMLSKWNTAVRNYSTFVGRYTVDSLDHAMTIPLAQLTGDTETAALSSALLRERGMTPFKEGGSVTPKSAWSDTLQGIHDFTIDSLNSLSPKDVRRSIRLLLDLPEAAAQYLGSTMGEDLSAGFSKVPVLRTITNPKVARVLTMFNRAQEFSARATVFDTTMRALLRAKGHEPLDLLQRPIEEIAEAVGGRMVLDDLLYTSTSAALEATFAGRVSKDSIPGWLIRSINDLSILKLGIPFPKFNFSAAPRWLFDHSPAAVVDLIRFPLDAFGVTSTEGTMRGGRLYRGVRAQTIERKTLPNLLLQIGQAEKAQGTALAELLSTQREMQIRNRQVARLEQRQQPGLQPEGQTPLTEAIAARDQLARRRETLKATMTEERRAVGDLKSEQKRLLEVLADARGINAPNVSQYFARMAVGTVGGLGAAWVIRAQPGAEGTRWYEYRVEREGKDPIVLDFRPFAPFAQYLFVADVMNDFYKHTNWETYHQQLEDTGGRVAGPLDRSKALWDNYEGKYTGQELGAQFAQAFLSISRAAGTTLTITDLMTQNGWPGPREAADAIIGTIGQFLSRFTVPLQQVRDVMAGPSGQWMPEEAKTRIPPRATTEDWERPIAAPLANIPGVSQLIPESISQTTGKPIAAEYPWLRALAGVGTAPRDFVTEEVRRVGVPGQSVFIRETGDVGLDRMVAERYAAILQQELPAELEGQSYLEQSTPARKRDYLQRYIFPALKRAALGEVREALGEERFQAGTVRGEDARRKARQLRLIDELIAREPELEVDDPEAPPAETGAGAGQVGEPPPGF